MAPKYMLRDANTALLAWKNSALRKPLVLMGARQVGKTYLLQHFAQKNFRKFHYLDFEERPDLHAIFEKNLTAERLARELSIASGVDLELDSDLFIFDEIQACPRALTSLKYFATQIPQLAVCAAGSLLGLELSSSSFPVGQVQMLDIHPLTFKEFVHAIDGEILGDILKNQISEDSFSEAAHQQLWQLLKLYFVSGGLPAIVALLAEQGKPDHQLLTRIRELQLQLIRNYVADMAKHCGNQNAMHLERIFRSSAAQVSDAQDGSTQRFKFKGVIPGVSQYSRFANAFDWLTKAGLITKISIIENPLIPLSAQESESRVKIFPFDVGILSALARVDPAILYHSDVGSYKGYVAENFVAQELRSSGISNLFAWQQSKAEVEFLLEHKASVVPLEVKSGSNTRSRSLSSFLRRYHPQFSFIASGKGLTSSRAADSPTMLPLYCVAMWKELVN